MKINPVNWDRLDLFRASKDVLPVHLARQPKAGKCVGCHLRFNVGDIYRIKEFWTSLPFRSQ